MQELELPDLGEDAGDDLIDQRYMVPGLSRGLALLRLFTRERPRQTIQELAQGLGITRSAAYRLAYTLEKDGYIARDDETRRYGLTPRVMALGFEYLAAQTIAELALPHLKQLSDMTNASSYLITPDAEHAVYIMRVAPPATVISNLQVGTRRPLHTTASGRVLFAALEPDERQRIMRRLRQTYPGFHMLPATRMIERADEDARNGYVYHASILDPGITSCAAGIRDNFGVTVAAITVIAPDHVLAGLGGEPIVSRMVRDVTAGLSEQMGYRPTPPASV
jgi:IclR family pca regulon transcriptional regulator